MSFNQYKINNVLRAYSNVNIPNSGSIPSRKGVRTIETTRGEMVNLFGERATLSKPKTLSTQTTSKLREILKLRSVILNELKNSLKKIDKINKKYDTKIKIPGTFKIEKSQAVGTSMKNIKSSNQNKTININFTETTQSIEMLLNGLKNELKDRTKHNSQEKGKRELGWKREPVKQLQIDIKRLQLELSKIKKIEKSVDVHNKKIITKEQTKEVKKVKSFSTIPHSKTKIVKRDIIRDIKTSSKTKLEEIRKNAKSELRFEKLKNMINEGNLGKTKTQESKNSVLQMINREMKSGKFTDIKDLFNRVKNEILLLEKSKNNILKIKALESIEKEVHKAGVGIGHSSRL